MILEKLPPLIREGIKDYFRKHADDLKKDITVGEVITLVHEYLITKDLSLDFKTLGIVVADMINTLENI